MKSRVPRTLSKRARKWVLYGVALVCVAMLGVVVAMSLINSRVPEKGGESKAPTSPTPAAPLPETAGLNFGTAVFDGWSAEMNGDPSTRFRADLDIAVDGVTSLRVDSSQAPGEPMARLMATLPVQPSTEYSFSAVFTSPSAHPDTAPVSVEMGSGDPQQFTFPEGKPEWTSASWTYTTGADETELRTAIVPGGVVSGFRLDTFSVIAANDGSDLIPNGSFELYSAPTFLRNTDLVLEVGDPGLDVVWFTESVDWSLRNSKDESVGSGTLALTGGEGTIPTTGLAQGFYKASVLSAAHPDASIETTFIVLDPVAPGSESDQRFGVAAHTGEYYVGAERAAAPLGVTSVRSDAYWKNTETTRGQYVFPSEYEAAFPLFAERGISVLPISNGPNPLYDNNSVPVSQEGIQAFANYTAALVKHYSSPAVEIFNELNTQRFNNSSCGVGADCYFPILKASFEAVKAASPDTLVVGPANGNQDDPYLTELYKLGGLDYLDVVSYHPYTLAPEGLIADIQQAQARIKEYNGGQSKPIWLTEFGWTANTGPDSETTQAAYLVRAQTIALSLGVERVYWYDLVNDSVDPTVHEGNFGLFTRATATVPAFQPKPAALAQALLIRKVAGKPFTSQDQVANTYSYVFGEGKDATRVAWTTAPISIDYMTVNPITVTAASGTTTIMTPVDGKVTVQLGGEPVYIQGDITAAASVQGG
jgi:hypothetical protein